MSNPCTYACIIFVLASIHSLVDMQGMIAGVTVGVIAFVALVAAAVVLWYRRQNYQNKLQPLGSEYEAGRASGAIARARDEATVENGPDSGGGAQTEPLFQRVVTLVT